LSEKVKLLSKLLLERIMMFPISRRLSRTRNRMTLQKLILIISNYGNSFPANIEELRTITLQDNENVTLLVETNDIVDYWAEDQIPLKNVFTLS
jgi:hypothetical protein